MSTLQNTTYHRSEFIATFTDPILGVTSLDFFGSNYCQLFRNNVRSFTTKQVVQRDSLDRLSYQYYKTTSLWWAIALYNDIIHPMQVVVGSSLKIPNKSDIDSFLSTFKATRTASVGRALTVEV